MKNSSSVKGPSSQKNADSRGTRKGRRTMSKPEEKDEQQEKQGTIVTVVKISDKEDKSDDRLSNDISDDSQSFDEAENVVSVRSGKDGKKRTRRRPPEKYAEYAAYRVSKCRLIQIMSIMFIAAGHTTSWAVLTKMEKQQLVLRAFAESTDGTVKCLNEKCTKTLKNIEDVAIHVDKCLKLPEYFKYVGKADVFRALDKVTKAKILRVSMNALEVLPCLNIETLNCTQKYGHRYALSYHLERCGQKRDQLPWKCWRCGLTATVAEGRGHLAICANSKMRAKGQGSYDESDSGNSGSDEMDIDNANNLRKNRKSDKQKMPSIAQGYLPEKSSRMKVSDGVKRFKFKSANLEASVPTPRNLTEYQETIDRANDLLRIQRENELPCNVLAQFEHHRNNFMRVLPCDFSEDLNNVLNKCSVPVVLPSGGSNKQQSASKSRNTNINNVCKDGVDSGKQRLPVFVPRSLHCKMTKAHSMLVKEDLHEIGCIAYCGGPISTIRSCPRKVEDGRECVAVTVFSDEEYLVSRNQKNCDDYVQFWLYDNRPERVIASLWFLLEVKYTTVLCTAWCPSLRGSVKQDKRLSNFVGILAVGGIKGPISIYGLCSDHTEFSVKLGTKSFGTRKMLSVTTKYKLEAVNLFLIRSDTPIPSTSDNAPFVYRCSEPDLILCCPECCGDAPIIAIAWSEKRENCSNDIEGHVLIWDIDVSITSAKIIHSTKWLSPPLNVAFCGMEQLAVSFREKLIRIYDLATLAFVIEESAQRTAGMQVYSREGLFNGIFSYQQDFTLSGSHLTCGTCYVVLGSSKENFFVVPLANRLLWDMCICPKTGAIISAGADGRLQVSLNGRLAAVGSEKDFLFSACRVVMTVIRKSVEAVEPALNADANAHDNTECKNEAKFPPPQTNLRLCAEKSYLEFCFEDIKTGKTPIPQFSLDLRTESLNRLSVSEPSGQLAICGGEAGLLIFIPCYL
uniref:Uncharacterized protein n=1 Tax=Setaria digitata TaxID=48799 RepID=A0A915PJB1_9BILA